MKETSKGAVPALQGLEHGLHPFVAFCIMPIFALSNAGVNLIDMDFSSLFSSNVIIGVLLGLLLGKPIGILLSTWVLTKLKLGNISKTMTWRQLTGIGFWLQLASLCRCLSLLSPLPIPLTSFRQRLEFSLHQLLAVLSVIFCYVPLLIIQKKQMCYEKYIS